MPITAPHGTVQVLVELLSPSGAVARKRYSTPGSEAVSVSLLLQWASDTLVEEGKPLDGYRLRFTFMGSGGHVIQQLTEPVGTPVATPLWQDRTEEYHEQGTVRKEVHELEAGIFMLRVSEHITFPGVWVGACDPIIEDLPLNATTREEAMQMMATMITGILTTALEALTPRP
jgi:hypothetical protein